jgi:hypothetical protein
VSVLLGFQHIDSAPPCPYCLGQHFAIEDDGAGETYKVLCWCGASARVAKADPDLVELLRQAKSQ